MSNDRVKEYLSSIPNAWLWIVGGLMALSIAFVGWLWLNKYTVKVEDKVVAECNTAQLERDLELERAARRRADQEAERLKALLAEREVEVVERVVFRDRVITKVREVEAEVTQTDEGALIEKVSPTTKTALEMLSARNQELDQ